MTPKFESDPLLSDPYDDTEQSFAASLDPVTDLKGAGAEAEDTSEPSAEQLNPAGKFAPIALDTPSANTPSPDPNAWREELSARLNSYRARRRPRTPRYPSLALKFDTPEELPSQKQNSAPPEPTPLADTAEAPPPEPMLHYAPTETGKIIEFPRLWEPPPRPADELADPVFDCPRILEAPEVVPPPPALGGMLIEDEPEPQHDKQLGVDIPLQSAPMSQRLIATAIDAVVVLLSFVMFAAVFSKMTAVVPPLQLTLVGSALLLGLLWSAYQFAMIVYAGTTLGLRLAHLRLSRFDGNPVPRHLRRWRALASILAGLSLGLGYAWCFLDEDALCWHDRITNTYLAPAPREK